MVCPIKAAAMGNGMLPPPKKKQPKKPQKPVGMLGVKTTENWKGVVQLSRKCSITGIDWTEHVNIRIGTIISPFHPLLKDFLVAFPTSEVLFLSFFLSDSPACVNVSPDLSQFNPDPQKANLNRQTLQTFPESAGNRVRFGQCGSDSTGGWLLTTLLHSRCPSPRCKWWQGHPQRMPCLLEPIALNPPDPLERWCPAPSRVRSRKLCQGKSPTHYKLLIHRFLLLCF